MKKVFSLCFCLVLILTGCSATYNEQVMNSFTRMEKQTPPADFIPKNVSVASVGDSLTEGVGDLNKQGGYIQYLKELMESRKEIQTANFLNFGVKGNRTDQLLQRLKQEEVKEGIENADLVIITIGGNDVMQVFKENLTGLQINQFLEAEKGYKQRLTEIMQLISTYNSTAEIVLVGIYNPFIKWFADITEVEQIITSWNQTSLNVISEFNHTSFVMVDDIFKNAEEDLLYTDYFHPNNKGYELMANRIYSSMEQRGILQSILE